MLREGDLNSDIEQWLKALELEQYVEAFAENGVDLDLLPEITNDDLKDLGVGRLADRKRILNAIAVLQTRQQETHEEPRASGGTLRVKSDVAERRQLTVMFCDLVGSTELAQRIDVEDLRSVMRRYQDVVARAVARYEGHVAKFLGDGALVYFGWPQAFEDQAERAVRAGLDALSMIENVKVEVAEPLQARIGIATGQVVVGDIVGDVAKETGAISGQTPNLAARLQGVARAGTIVIDPTTRQLIGTAFELKDLGAQHLKGFSNSIHAWSVIGERDAESRFETTHEGTLTRLIGREHELGLMLDRWSRSVEGEGQVVVLSGEAGIGKSRIAREVRDRLGKQRYFLLRYQCSPHHTNSALYPIIRRLEKAAGFAPEDSSDDKLNKLEALLRMSSEKIAGIAPLFAGLLSLPEESRYGKLSLSPQQRRQQTIDAMIDQVLALSRQRPVFFLLEDMHWVDPTTEALIGQIIGHSANAPVFILITHRPTYRFPWMGQSHVTTVTLNRLGRKEGLAIAREVADGTLSDEAIDRIVARSDGVPLFVEELTRSVVETGTTNTRGTIPQTLQASLLARLDRLEDAKEVIQIGAVIGREFTYGLLSKIVDQPAQQLNAALDKLEKSALVKCHGIAPESTYTFKHALVQDAAYESVLREPRRRIHQRVAKALIADRAAGLSAEPELIAYHFDNAGEPSNAVHYWLEAGEASIQRAALNEAADQLRSGLTAVAAITKPTARLETELRLQAALGLVLRSVRGSGNDELGEAYKRAYELCLQTGSNLHLAPSLFGLVHFNWARGQLSRSLKYAEELKALTANSSANEQQLVGNAAISIPLWHMGENTAAKDYLQAALEVYDQQQHAALSYTYGIDFGVISQRYFGFCCFVLGHFDQARRSAELAVELARNGPPQGLCHALVSNALTMIWLRLPEQALQWAEEATALAVEHGYPHWLAGAQIFIGWSHTAMGDSSKNIESMKSACEMWEGSGIKAWSPHHRTLLAEAYTLDGRPELALPVLEEAFTRIDQNREYQFESFAHCTKGDALFALADHDSAEAESCYREAIHAARSQSAKGWELRAANRLARIWQTQKKFGEARDLLATVYGGFKEGLEFTELNETRSLLDKLG